MVGPDLISFAKRGGKIRLIYSPSIADEDVKAMAKGYKNRNELLENSLINDIDQLLGNKEITKSTEALATLISVGALEIKIVFKPGAKGIFHEKLGLFYDENDNCVCFPGSINETWNGWHERGNAEAFSVFCSFLGGRDYRESVADTKYFEDLWGGYRQDLEIFLFPNIAVEKLNGVAKNSLDEIEPNDLIDFFRVRNSYEKVEKKNPELINKKKPLPHQLKAIAGWEKQGKRGVFEHATGSGIS